MEEYVQSSDVVIVGDGMAGLQAARAVALYCPGLKVTILTAGELGTGGCSRKTHGINAAINPGDRWQQHVEDTLKGGGYINDPELVAILCREIPTRLRELEGLGVEFNRINGEYDVGIYGGSSQGRSIHWFDLTGLQIVQTLVKQVTLAGCHVREHRWVVELITEAGSCDGVIALNRKTHRIETYLAKATILATGGGACVYPIATISPDKLATGMMMSYNAGASLVDLEMVQFHPTGLVQPGGPGHGEIMEEELRAWGGQLLNREGKRFMFDYDPRGELATRDIVARSSYLEIMQGRGTANEGVIFDISAIPKAELLQRFPYMVQRLRSFGVDLQTQDRIEISPSAHYLMGGVRIDPTCETEIRGLFSCGEDAGGIDGGNRLGGNGVAGTLVFGHEAGLAAGHYAEGRGAQPKLPAPREITYYWMAKHEQKALEQRVKAMMWRDVGLVRTGRKLERALSWLEQLEDRLRRKHLRTILSSEREYGEQVLSGKVLLYKLQLARLITLSALARRNSVGAHFREDAVEEGERYNVVVQCGRSGDPEVKLQPTVDAYRSA